MRCSIALVVLVGCDRGAPPPDAEPVAPTKVAEEVAPAKPEIVAPAITAEPPVAPASERVLAPIGAAPPWPAVLALARAEGLRKPAQAAALVGLGGDRWAAAIRTTDHEGGEEGGGWTTHVLLVDAAAKPLRVVDRRALVSWSDVGEEHPERAPIALFAEDYDGDGLRELLVRFGFTLMLCGIGEVERRELRVYGTGDDGKLHPQVALTLDDRVYFGADIGRESFADRNGDGRADLVVTERSEHEDVDDENEGRPIRAKAEVVYTYDAKRDAYARASTNPTKGRGPVDFRIWDTCGEGESPGSSPL